MNHVLRRAVLGVALVAAASIVGVAIAGQALTHHTHAASSVIQACTNQEGGVRIVDAVADCKKNESPLAWNIQGPQGVPGVSVTTAQLPAGDSHCANGGLQVTAVSGITFVCNGANGKDGKNGVDGKDGVSVTTTTLSPGDANCAAGGVKVSSASGDSFVCNGAKGDTGATGATGAQGPPGSSAATTLTSPNGTFKVEITDQGIYLRGPTKTLFVNRFNAGTGGPLAR